MPTLCTTLLLLLALTPPTHAQPNILILLADDQRSDAIHALGNDQIFTPTLDALAAQGVAFTRAYCRGSDSGAVCAPSRAMLLAGRDYPDLPLGFRIPWAGPAESRGICDSPLLPETFRAAGYDTFATGKWHNGRPSFNACFTHADEVFFGGMGSHTELPVHDFDPTGSYAPDHAHTIESFSSQAFADATIDFIASRDADSPPFLAWVAFTAPHDPRTPPAEYRAMYDESALDLPRNFLPDHPFDNGELNIRDENLAPHPRTPDRIRAELADYDAMITHLDAQVGRILAALDEHDLRKNTIIVYLADHGLAIGSHGLLGKQNLYEHSARAPLIFAVPGGTGGLPASVPPTPGATGDTRGATGDTSGATGGSPASAPQGPDAPPPPGARLQSLVYLHDLYPTLCDLAGIDTPPTVTSRSLAPLLIGAPDAYQPRDAIILGYRNVQRALVTDRWKLIAYPKIGKVQLFDLDTDPDETHDLDASHPDRTAAMLADLVNRLNAANDTIDTTNLVP